MKEPYIIKKLKRNITIQLRIHPKTSINFHYLSITLATLASFLPPYLFGIRITVPLLII